MSLSGIYIRVPLLVSLLLLVGGCGSMVGHHKVEDLHSVPVGVVPARTYEASFDEVRKAALYSVERTGLENLEERQTGDADWYLTAEIGYSWRSNGQFVRVTARTDPESSSPRTYVFYTSLRRFDVNVTEDLGVVRDNILNLMDSYIESL